jgi:hypothetical protein
MTPPAEEAGPADETAAAEPAIRPTHRSLLLRAAQCYLRADLPEEAARCYREAGAPAQAAALWERAGHYDEAARDYANAGMRDRSAWLFVHWLDNPQQARAEIATWRPTDVQSTIVRELILARCAAAEDPVAAGGVLAVERAAGYLAQPPTGGYSLDVEVLAVAVADALHRPDLSALVFAAAVRSGHLPAIARWQEWSLQTLHTPLVLPEAWSREAEREAAP